MFKWLRGFMMIMALVTIVLGGCSQQSDDFELENQELRSEVKELEQMIEEKNDQIERYKKEYELRNILDVEVRKLLSALNSGVFSENEEKLLHENIVIEEDRLVISFENYTNEILFFQNKLDFEWVRQRYYLLDDEGRFITGYEVLNISDDVEERIASRRVLVFTFIEESSGWELIDIGIDR